MPSDAAQPADLAGDLERFLLDLDRLYTELESVLEAKKDAFRTADADRLAGVLNRERTIFSSIDSIEHRRRKLVADTGRASGVAFDAMRTSVSDLASTLQPTDAERIRAMSTQVRDHIERVRRESAVLREVASKLHLHLQSLGRRLHYATGGSGVYQRSGQFQNVQGTNGTVDFCR